MDEGTRPGAFPGGSRGVSGRVFLLGGIALFLLIAAVALFMIVGPSPEPVDQTFWGTPTPTPRPGALPF